MNPAEKYMPEGKYRASDMNFVPFNNTNNTNNTSNTNNANNMGMDMGMNMNINTTNNTTTAIGWIPVYFFNNMNTSFTSNMNGPFTNLVNTLPKISNSNMNTSMSGSMPTPTSMTPTQFQNLNSYANQYPDYTNTSTLYSYNDNNANNNNPNNNNSISNTSTNYSSTMNKSMTTNKARSLESFEPLVIQALREFDLDLDESIDLERNNDNNRTNDNYQIDKIFRAIEKDNPGTFSLLQAYNVPYPVIKLLIRRVIKLTLTYCKKDGE